MPNLVIQARDEAGNTSRIDLPFTIGSGEPATVRTVFGACPDSGGAAGVLSKYGPGAAIRWFDGGQGLGNVPTRPAQCSVFHASWKPSGLTAVTETAVRRAVANLRDGDITEVWHESDVKYRGGQTGHGQTTALATLTYRLNMKTEFHRIVATLRQRGDIPDVRTCNTWAGWSVDTTSSVNPASPSLHCDADLLGIDMDGIPASVNFYDYAGRQFRSPKLAAAYRTGEYTGWTVPEFCMPSVSGDTGSARRIAWFRGQVAAIRQGIPDVLPPPATICWFDTAGVVGATERLTTTQEIAAWRELVAGAVA